MGKDSTFEFPSFNGASDSYNNFNTVKAVSLVPSRHGDSMEEGTEVNGADRKVGDGVEGGRFGDCAIIGWNNLEGIVAAKFEEELFDNFEDSLG